MKKLNIIAALSTIIMILLLDLLIKNVFLSALITIIILIPVFSYISFLYAKNINRIIEVECNPYKYLYKLDDIQKSIKKNGDSQLGLCINQSVALICLGDNNKALEILQKAEDLYLKTKRLKMMILYNLALVTCYFSLNDIESANAIIEARLSKINIKDEKIMLSIRLTLVEQLYYQNHLQESKAYFNDILDENSKYLTKLDRLHIIYKLAQIDEKEGNISDAKVKYTYIVANNNALKITRDSQLKLKTL